MANRNFDIDLTDNFERAIEEFNKVCQAGLEEVGQRVETYASALCPVGTTESTGVQHYSGGTLRQSITHKVVDYEVYIGSNLYHAAFVEHGTGIYADNGQGRQSPWVWRDKNGDYHWTRGIEPQHFLLKAVTEHDNEYMNVFKNAFNF
ncbi:MAG: HK97 gp10 family phage protein [Oscillospiraceae bacterium]|nr:HK97 gp10 family phage protein [Oscillospiraceae bacterium]